MNATFSQKEKEKMGNAGFVDYSISLNLYVQYRNCYGRAALWSFLQIYLVKLFGLAISEPSNILSNLYATGRGTKYSN